MEQEINTEFHYENNRITLTETELIYYEAQKGYTNIKIEDIKSIFNRKYHSPSKIFHYLSSSLTSTSPTSLKTPHFLFGFMTTKANHSDSQLDEILILISLILYIISLPVLIILSIVNKNKFEIKTNETKLILLLKYKDKSTLENKINYTNYLAKNPIKEKSIQTKEEKVEESKKTRNYIIAFSVFLLTIILGTVYVCLKISGF